jgi:hypothetical protein
LEAADCKNAISGEVAEWLMAPVLKTGIPEKVSGVRIPPSPPDFVTEQRSGAYWFAVGVERLFRVLISDSFTRGLLLLKAFQKFFHFPVFVRLIPFLFVFHERSVPQLETMMPGSRAQSCSILIAWNQIAITKGQLPHDLTREERCSELNGEPPYFGSRHRNQQSQAF